MREILEKKDLVNQYNINSIILINNIIPISTYTEGEGSDIASVFYKIDTIHCFKNSENINNLCVFGVDYWSKDSNNLTLLEENSIYFILVNKKENIKKK